MIVLWGSPLDEPIAAVRTALENAARPHVVLDPRQVLETELELTVGEELRGTLTFREQRIELADVRALYLRPADPSRIPAVERAGLDTAAHRHAVGLHESLRVFTELCSATVINRLSAMASNSSKPFQARLIEASGFSTPETLLTTDPDAVRAFYERHRDLIYKSVSGVRSIVASLTRDALGKLAFVQNCPTQFQRRVSGVDYRVHVIGAEVFTTRIESTAVDYRYAGRSGLPRPQMSVARLPPAEHARCLALARTLDLAVAGIDLRLTPDGRWYCFEVNPSPAFTFYAEGNAMAVALAELLGQGAREGRARRHAAGSSSPPAKKQKTRDSAAPVQASPQPLERAARRDSERSAVKPKPKPEKKRRQS